jgi:hypothetical protein
MSRKQLLTDREVEVLVERTSESNDTRSRNALARKAQRVVDWATAALVDRELLRQVMAGELAVIVPSSSRKPLGFIAKRRAGRRPAEKGKAK